MDYIKIRFGNAIEDLECRFEQTLEEMFCAINPVFKLSDRTWNPSMDMYETPEEIMIVAEIAGVEKEELEVEINAKAVRISGNRKEIPRARSANYRLAEIRYGGFERILFLPSLVDPEVVSASYVNGLLQIRLAKIRTDKTHKIQIED
jgi:HSP20 family protein